MANFGAEFRSILQKRPLRPCTKNSHILLYFTFDGTGEGRAFTGHMLGVGGPSGSVDNCVVYNLHSAALRSWHNAVMYNLHIAVVYNLQSSMLYNL